MFRVAVVIGVVCCLFICRPTFAQQSKDLELLKKEIELLKKENELLKKENELLKKENEQLKNSGGKKDGDDKTDKPTATADGVTYVVDKVTRNGPKVTLQMVATNSKADCIVVPGQVEAVDGEGNVYKTLNPRLRLTLREGVKTKFEVVIPNVPGKVMELSRVDIHLEKTKLGEPDKEPILLKKVKIEK